MRMVFRKIHKWVFIFTGVFMLLWVLTGVLLSLPIEREWKALDINRVGEKIAYSEITLSPSAAVSILRNAVKTVKYVKGIQLKNIHGRIMYVIRDDANNTHLVNAENHQYYQFSIDEAEARVKKLFGISGSLIDGVVLNKHSLDYIWGELPVYKLQFADNPVYYVRPLEATVSSSTLLTQAQVISGLLHTLEPVKFLPQGERLRWVLMVFIGFIALLGTLTGIYLTLPKRKKKV